MKSNFLAVIGFIYNISIIAGPMILLNLCEADAQDVQEQPPRVDFINFHLKNATPHTLYTKFFYKGEKVAPIQSEYGVISPEQVANCSHIRVGCIVNVYRKMPDGTYRPVYSVQVAKGMANDTTVIAVR